MLAHGHPAALHYPIGMVVDEAQIVSERINNLLATEAVLTQMAVSAADNPKSHKEFTKLIKGLTEE